MNTPREEIVQFLHHELIGPDPRPEHATFLNGTPYDEILRPQDPPRIRYSAGVLFPLKSLTPAGGNLGTDEVESSNDSPSDEVPDLEAEPETQSSSGTGAEHQVTDSEINRANEYLPSAMGLTVLLEVPTKLRVTVSAARYERIAKEGLGKPDKKTGAWQKHHWRRPFQQTLELNCDAFEAARPVRLEPKVWIDNSAGPQSLELHVFSRPHHRGGKNERIVTFALLNRLSCAGDSPKDDECYFQCGFRVESANGKACFLEYPEQPTSEAGTDVEGHSEEESLRLLYRHRRTFAVGHGCAANWVGEPTDRAEAVMTETLPQWEIKPIVASELDGLRLSFLDLASEDDSSIELCRQLSEAYSKWIDGRSKEVADLPRESQRATAERHLDSCRNCLERMRAGVLLLKTDSKIRQAFAWMNEAMHQQQLRYDLATNYRREWMPKTGILALTESLGSARERQKEDPRSTRMGRWRPFQLAFILMNLRSISDRSCEERNLVDLIWFPTGGGKTEAYLGLTALSIFWRRLDDPTAAGTTVLMRYTLRLLTTQQFQRAASLICACEIIREQKAPRLGKIPISIGLWVGGDVTPNNQEGAAISLRNLLRDGRDNPFAVLTCPWCGAEMGPVKMGQAYRTPGYRAEKGKFSFRCEDAACEFSRSSGLPLYVVDEAIYEARPTLLIGTVDKFATLPWREEARSLFGLNEFAPVPPPDLIIQDELHLISGALGSMVGMYEGTLDALCRHGREKWPAKIIASTATICRSSSQISALYARPSFLFPPQGLRAGDSFFAEENQSAPGRLYLGVFGSALGSHVTAQIRTMGALLQAVEMTSAPAKEIDAYWTLMSYFNSLRELGHAATLIRADIRDYLNAMWDRLGVRSPKQGGGPQDRRRFIDRDIELTSRVQSRDIPDLLQQLFTETQDLLRPDGRREIRGVDVCLATNMIQVGLDVSRLGLMTIAGQPKTTSEYVQASSRVGRSASGPGLVVTIYNTGKPRDRSHFEHFRAYHQTIYRWVEPTSVTPFAIPVRERGLHAQLVTLARYQGDRDLRDSPSHPPTDARVQEWLEVILKRVRAVDEGEVESAERMLKEFLADWQRLMPQKYGQMANVPQQPTPLLYPNGMPPFAIWGGRSKPTPTSMRNVDAGCDATVIADFPKE